MTATRRSRTRGSRPVGTSTRPRERSPPQGGWASSEERKRTRDACRQLLRGLDRVWDLRRCLASLGSATSRPKLPALPLVDAARCSTPQSSLEALLERRSSIKGRRPLRAAAVLRGVGIGGAGAPLRKLLNQDDFGERRRRRRAWGAGRRRRPCSAWLWTRLFLEARRIAWSSAAPAEFGLEHRYCAFACLARAVASANRARLRQQLPGLLLDWAQLVEDARRADARCAEAALPNEHAQIPGHLGPQILALLMERTLALDVSLELVDAAD